MCLLSSKPSKIHQIIWTRNRGPSLTRKLLWCRGCLQCQAWSAPQTEDGWRQTGSCGRRKYIYFPNNIISESSKPDNVPMLDLWLDDNSPQSIEAADEVAHRVGEKVVAIGDPSFKKFAFKVLVKIWNLMLRMNLFLPERAFLRDAKREGDKVGEMVMWRQREGLLFHSLVTRLCNWLLVMDKLSRAECGRNCMRWQRTRLGRCSRHMWLLSPPSSAVSIISLTTFWDSERSSMVAPGTPSFLLEVGVQRLEVLMVGWIWVITTLGR